MFVYNKKLQYPVKIDKPNPKLASIIISQYGGPDGELGASLRYLSQRYSMPFDEANGASSIRRGIEIRQLRIWFHISNCRRCAGMISVPSSNDELRVLSEADSPYFTHICNIYPNLPEETEWYAREEISRRLWELLNPEETNYGTA